MHPFRLSVSCVFLGLAFCLGCDVAREPKVIIEMPAKEFAPLPIDESRAVVICVVERNDRRLGISVHIGDDPDDKNEIHGKTFQELISILQSRIDEILVAKPQTDSILLNCDGSVKTGDIEKIRASLHGFDMRFYVGVLGYEDEQGN